jgi:hypothetical protein
MAGYAPNHRKQHKLCQKRERELLHAISAGVAADKTAKLWQSLSQQQILEKYLRREA